MAWPLQNSCLSEGKERGGLWGCAVLKNQSSIFGLSSLYRFFHFSIDPLDPSISLEIRAARMLNCLSPGRSSTCQCQCTCQGSKASKEGGEKKQQTFLGHFLHRIQISFATKYRDNKRYQLYRETGKDNKRKNLHRETGRDKNRYKLYYIGRQVRTTKETSYIGK